MTKVFITGANGFIGNWLIRTLLKKPNIQITALDINTYNLDDSKDSLMDYRNLTFLKLDLLAPKNQAPIEEFIKEADIIIPLAAIANPYFYVKKPLDVFKLDFEHNLQIVKWVVKHRKRLIFPSTSEVYGMSEDAVFAEDETKLVLGPVHKMRWIYSCSKQLLDRVICAYGIHKGLSYTLFRPFNWMGPRLDNISATQEGHSRALTQFMSNAINGRPIRMVDGGAQRRTFIYIKDAIEALVKIIENKDNHAQNQIFNIGNPQNDISIHELAEIILEEGRKIPKIAMNVKKCKIEDIHSHDYFGDSYEDVSRRVPSIEKAKKLLGWHPTTPLRDAIRETLEFYVS
jgi:nucleoside-diphosphate-sugar epimerase